MDARIEQKLTELRQAKEDERLWRLRINASLSNLKDFLEENRTGIEEIFRLVGKEFLCFHDEQSKDHLFCYNPKEGFHLRYYGQSQSPGGPVTQEIKHRFKHLKSLVVVFSGNRRNQPEELLNCFASAFEHDSNFKDR